MGGLYRPNRTTPPKAKAHDSPRYNRHFHRLIQACTSSFVESRQLPNRRQEAGRAATTEHQCLDLEAVATRSRTRRLAKRTWAIALGRAAVEEGH